MTRTASHDTAGKEARVRRLRAARTQDSEAKTARALDVVRDLLASGQRVTCARVAREASVSTWFVYNQPQVRDAVQAAMHEQREHGRRTTAAPGPGQVTPAGLHTELALAREEIKDLKRERDRLRERVRLSLGAELDDVGRRQLVERIRQLEQQNTELRHELSEARDRLTDSERRLQEAEDDLTAARASLRRAMRAVPSK
ncbi:DUF6262 family protein [Streptomyces sp. NPDC001601]|uniref:DUF6262 family protein n=1 Tax=Streptomyces sp. NPDC001601 TaxID=3364592 RepID=UPI00369EE0D8